ncbi:Vacuolar protein 8 [Mycoemilia scoparia]|uniref:Vacuolar protein 8 n=1 Tax=Mycoemilia scoparia TaxID=417184 RepID=A0A9W8DWH1_9FUNG|nr:Vacuolar protein 8 [Mycoemilia scoparia]
MGANCSSACNRFCCNFEDLNDQSETQSLLAKNERDAVDLIVQLFGERETRYVDFYEPRPMEALSTLAYSGELRLQRSAALAYSEITEQDVRPVTEEMIQPILYLLRVPSLDVQKNASAALGNLTRCRCITNLATADENKEAIANSGALIPLLRLAKSSEIRVQRNAVGALMNMTHTEKTRELLVRSGAIPVLVSLLSSPDHDVEYYCATALSNIAVGEQHRQILAEKEPALGPELIRLMSSEDVRVKSQATLALRNLASHEIYQRDLIRQGVLIPLRVQMVSGKDLVELAAVACLRNLSILEENEVPIVNAGFLPPLIAKLDYSGYIYWSEMVTHIVAILRNLTSGDHPSSDESQHVIVKEGALKHMKYILEDTSVDDAIKNEVCATLGALASNSSLKAQIVNEGLLEVFIHLTSSQSHDVQISSASAIAYLATEYDDYTPIIALWNQPADGIKGYLESFLVSDIPEFRYVAIFTVLVFLRSQNGDIAYLIYNQSSIGSLLDDVARQENGAIYESGGVTSDPNSGFPRSFTGSTDEQYIPLQTTLSEQNQTPDIPRTGASSEGLPTQTFLPCPEYMDPSYEDESEHHYRQLQMSGMISEISAIVQGMDSTKNHESMGGGR